MGVFTKDDSKKTSESDKRFGDAIESAFGPDDGIHLGKDDLPSPTTMVEVTLSSKYEGGRPDNWTTLPAMYVQPWHIWRLMRGPSDEMKRAAAKVREDLSVEPLHGNGLYSLSKVMR